MAATRNTDPEAPAAGSGFTEEQETRLTELIAAAVAGATPPKTDDNPKGPPAKTDAEWDAMTDRARESWVRSLVDSELDRLAREDDHRRLTDDVERLKAEKTVEPEAVPSTWSKIQRLIWGERDK